MPRTGRIHIDGGCYHLMGRGLERRFIFASDEDKTDFIARVASGLGDTDADCLAWAVMSNHYHLLVRTGRQPLSGLMRTLLGGTRRHFLSRHEGTWTLGHGDRFGLGGKPIGGIALRRPRVHGLRGTWTDDRRFDEGEVK